jgi:uncharacterized protein YndB with AHSA1/START domain
MVHRKVTSAVIARSVEEVFDWITTTAFWPRYSPATLGITFAEAERPLKQGDRFRQTVRIHDWRGHFDWTVEILDRPYRCVLTGVSSGDGFVSRLTGHDDVRLELTFSGDAVQTAFTRDLSYHVGLAEAIGDVLGFGRAVDETEDITVTTLVSILENPLLFGTRSDFSSEQWLHEADPLGDDAVESLVSADGDCTRLETFIADLYRGVPKLGGLPDAVRRFFDETSELPSWACKPRIAAASAVFLDWGVLAVGAHICASLPETYVLPRVAKLLNLTRQLDANPTHADRRLWFTVRMCFDVLTTNGLDPDGEGRLALQRLRIIHSTIRLFVQRRLQTPNRLSRLSSEELWDTQNGKPISQLELLHTLLTFSHVVLRSLQILGAELTPYQRESYIHLWNVAGAQLGIRPELLPRDAEDAARMFETLKSRYGAATPEAMALGRALVWFWTSLFPADVANEAKELMQFVIGELLSPETAKINGLDTLPIFSPTAADAVKGFLDVAGRLCAFAFEEIPGARQATALFVSLLMRAKTERVQNESGTFDVPEELYERWTEHTAGVKNGGVV